MWRQKTFESVFYLAGWPAWIVDAGAATTPTCRAAGNFFLSPTWRCRRVLPPPPLPDSRKLTPAEGLPSKLVHEIQSYQQHSGFVLFYGLGVSGSVFCSVADPRSRVRCYFDPWIRNGVGKKLRSSMNIPDNISESLEEIVWVKILRFFDADPGSLWPGIRDEKNSDPG